MLPALFSSRSLHIFNNPFPCLFCTYIFNLFYSLLPDNSSDIIWNRKMDLYYKGTIIGSI